MFLFILVPHDFGVVVEFYVFDKTATSLSLLTGKTFTSWASWGVWGPQKCFVEDVISLGLCM